MRPNGDEPVAMAGSGGGNRSSDGWVVGRGVQGEVVGRGVQGGGGDL